MKTIYKFNFYYKNCFMDEWEEQTIYGISIESLKDELKENYFFENSGGRISSYWLRTYLECDRCGLVKQKDYFDFITEDVIEEARAVCNGCWNKTHRMKDFYKYLDENKVKDDEPKR